MLFYLTEVLAGPRPGNWKGKGIAGCLKETGAGLKGEDLAKRKIGIAGWALLPAIRGFKPGHIQ